jgi:hypothetical protein
VTPLGTFANSAAEDKYSDSGWLKTSEVNTASVSTSTEVLSGKVLSEGYFPSKIAAKPQGMPADWVYWYDMPDSGWVAPAKLLDPRFVEKNMPAWAKPVSRRQ